MKRNVLISSTSALPSGRRRYAYSMRGWSNFLSAEAAAGATVDAIMHESITIKTGCTRSDRTVGVFHSSR
ncbi:MAG TPA: hypothetical protein VMX58_02610 [Patescibacteria group bacterium]|nr:hypothetical protein [Patescibacteria group bacterium]